MRPLRSLNESVANDITLAKQEIGGAWIRYRQSAIKYFKDGLEFGRTCHQWQARYRAQGSRSGRGFERLLEELHIPKTTAYRWIRRYEIKWGLRAKGNEVRVAPNLDRQTPTVIRSVEERTSFVFLLTDDQRQQFCDDVRTLGGQRRVAKMFLDFVSQKAFEKRSAESVKEKTSPGREDTRHLGVGA